MRLTQYPSEICKKENKNNTLQQRKKWKEEQTKKLFTSRFIEMEAYHYKNERFRGKGMKNGQKMEEMDV